MASKKSSPPRKVLITDPVSQECLQTFEADGRVEITCRPGIGPDDLLEAIKASDGLIVRSGTRVTSEVIEAAPRLEVIVRAGTGVDNIDVDAATARGVVVMNTPGGNTISAAEHTISLLLALSRKIPQAVASMRSGKWDRKQFVGVEVTGKTLGVVGLGKVGRAVAERARALEMEVSGCDPYLSDDVISGLKVNALPFEEILETSDYITFHVPLTERTRHLLGKEELRRCRRGVRIINCARGGVIDEAALKAAIENGVVAGAALDVFQEEPPRDRSLIEMDQVIATPHLGASTEEAIAAVGIASARQTLEFFTRGVVRGGVNTVDLDARFLKRTAPNRDLARRLGSLQAQILDGGVEEMSLSFLGEPIEDSTQEILSLSFLQGFLGQSMDAPINLVNARHVARERGIHFAASRGPRAQGYSFLLLSRVSGKAGEHTLSGSLFGDRSPRVVDFDGHDVEARPEGWMLLMASRDSPGMIGRMGKVIGDGDVNIANLSLGRDRSGGRAVSIFNLDSAAPEGVLEGLRGLDGVLWVRQVRI